MQMSMRKLNSHTILQLWCCCHVMYKLLYPSIRVRTAPSVLVRVRVRVNVSFGFGVTPLRILICMCPKKSLTKVTSHVFIATIKNYLHRLSQWCNALYGVIDVWPNDVIITFVNNNNKIYQTTQWK